MTSLYIFQIVVKNSASSVRCTRINGNSMKMSDLLKEDSVLLKVFSGLPKVILKVLKDLEDDWLVWIPSHVYCLFVCKTNNVF